MGRRLAAPTPEGVTGLCQGPGTAGKIARVRWRNTVNAAENESAPVMQAQHLSNLLDSPSLCPTHAIPPFYTWIQFRAKVTAATAGGWCFGRCACIDSRRYRPRQGQLSQQEGAGGSAGQIDQLDNRHAERLGGCGQGGKGVDSLQRSSQVAFDSIGPELGGLRIPSRSWRMRRKRAWWRRNLPRVAKEQRRRR